MPGRAVIAPGIEGLRAVIQRGVASGEFSDTGLSDFPMMLMSPVIASVIWTHLFSKEVDFDMNAALQAHLETMMVGLKA